ncbi:MAG: hypothetical protein KJ000_34110 [Pirellulaceae bacterium]|nr:hypothetical protein [Pirellulaceae bacterium]
MLFLSALPMVASPAAEAIRVGRFEVDATPPVGSPLAYDPMKEATMQLSCRGVVILGDQQPIVLCSVDWIGISNDGHRVFRQRLAEAAGTTPQRVAVHAVHQHDAPRLDFSAESILSELGLSGTMFNVVHARTVIDNASAAVARAVEQAEPVTHVGLGEGVVEEVASNRRIQGPDGQVLWTRYTSGASQERNREAPVGLIDPTVKLIVFFQGDRPLVALTYYACHPQSYYRTGGANPDFPGIARGMREKATDTFHIHFNGAGGNIGAGKWNDGSPPYRQILAERLAAGMEKAWLSVRRTPVGIGDLGWAVEPVALPLGQHVVPEELQQRLADPATPDRPEVAKTLVWARRCLAGEKIDLQCLRLGQARVLHMPGELCVEYQLAAQKMRPELFVAMTAYGEYAPGYICTEVAYSQGGYEASQRASHVAPEVERVLTAGMKKLLEADTR